MEKDNDRKEEVSERDNAEETSLTYANKKEVARGGVLGLFIGLAVIVPGVSGSAVAIIFRLYEKLLYAVGNIFKRFGTCVKFLLPVVIGGVIGFVAGFFGVRALLSLLPFAIVALFAGLMLGAFPSVTDQIKGERITPVRVLLFIAGLAIPVAMTLVSIFLTEGARSLEGLTVWHFLLFALLGALVALTQIVPGLSATALLMMFGYFTPLMESVSLSYWQSNPLVFLVYVCFGVGFLAGLFLLSKGMSALMKGLRAPTFFTVAGLSLGSIATMFFNPEITAVYSSWAAGAPMLPDLIPGIVLFIVGVIVSYMFVRFERKKA